MAYRQRTRSGENCSADEGQGLTRLGAALEAEPQARDAELIGLELCGTFEPGLMTALRAELAPLECADVIVEGFLAQPERRRIRLDIEHALIGAALAARAARLVRNPPLLESPVDKSTMLEYFGQQLKPWVISQAQAIFVLSERGVQLEGYGRALVAVEAGIADMRFVDLAREVPLPKDMEADAEVREVYYAALDEALGARKARGRDAALIGLLEMAEQGVRVHRSVTRARELLSRLYGGRRIDALDGLLLPALPEASRATPELRLAASLPSFYSGYLLRHLDLSEAALVRALIERGLPPAARAVLSTSELSGPVRRWYARGLVDLGRAFWRAQDFQEAAQAAAGGSEELELLHALAAVLKSGPRNAAEMMRGQPILPRAVSQVEPLDRIRRGPLAGMAAFDAAYLMSLVPVRQEQASYWQTVSERFARAAGLLPNPEHKQRARERSEEAQEIAQAAAASTSGAKAD